MQTYTPVLAFALSFLTSEGVLSAQSVLFQGTFNVPTSQDIYDSDLGDFVTVATNDSFFGTGGVVPYTLAISYNAPATPGSTFTAGDFYNFNGTLRVGESRYGYTASTIVGVTISTTYGSYTYTPGVDNFRTLGEGGDTTSVIFFDTDLALATPTKARFIVESGGALDGFFSSLSVGFPILTSGDGYQNISWAPQADMQVLDVPSPQGETADYLAQSGYAPYTSVPEPSATLLGGIGMLALARRRRSA